MTNVAHVVLNGGTPFVVEFIHIPSQRRKVVRYDVPLTKLEVEAQYDYIIFDESKDKLDVMSNDLEAVKNALVQARPYALEVEVIAWALKEMKDDPTISISTAISRGIHHGNCPKVDKSL
jgi:hypothetical protein